MIRALRPTDLAAFLAFRARAPANEVLMGPALRASRLTVRDFAARSLALEPGRETWVVVEHGQIFGLVSARERFGTDVWDIDRLMVSPAVDEDRACVRLLAHLCEAAVEEGVQKVFLRLPLDSSWLGPTRQAGFVQYTTEQVLMLPRLERPTRVPVPGVRPRRARDHQALFQLYSHSVPGTVRQIEALTLQEWRWSDNWGLVPVGPLRRALPRRRRDLVVEMDGQIRAWVQVHVKSRTLQFLTDPRDPPDVPSLIELALHELPAPGAVVFALRDYQSEFESALIDRGFVPGESQALLARMLGVRIPEPRLVPARVV